MTAKEREHHRRDILDWIHIYRALWRELVAAEKEIRRLRKALANDARP